MFGSNSCKKIRSERVTLAIKSIQLFYQRKNMLQQIKEENQLFSKKNNKMKTVRIMI